MPPSSRRVLIALTSPIRQEMASALGHGPTTVTDLATQLGRTRQSLYYHMSSLVSAGIAAAAGWRGTGKARERLYRLATKEVGGAPRSNSPAELALVSKAVDAMLRLTARELRAAMADPSRHATDHHPPIGAMRGKARLSDSELDRLHRLFNDIRRLLAGAKARKSGGKLYSVTLVLTPSRAIREH